MTHKDRTGTSADHLCPFAQCGLPCERRLSFGIPQIPAEGPPPTLEFQYPLQIRESDGCGSWVLGGRASLSHLSSIFPHLPLPQALCGTASRPSRNTSLLGMPASGGHRLWEPCQHGSPLCPQLFTLHSFSWDQSSLMVPRLAPSYGRLMRPVHVPHP